MMNKTSTTINSRCWGDLSFQSARVKHRNTACSFFQVELMEPRNLLFAVNSRIGALCLCFSRPPSECTQGLEAFSRSEKDRVARELGSATALVLLLAHQCSINLPLAIQLKIQLNAKKYPAALVSNLYHSNSIPIKSYFFTFGLGYKCFLNDRGSALKYDAYQEHTGFGKDSKQMTTGGEKGDDHLEGDMLKPWANYTLEDLRIQIQQFAEDRRWDKFHTPRNICLALSGEAGELCELFQFREEEECCTGLTGWTKDARDKLGQELSDVCIYLCRLSDLCAVDLAKVLEDDCLVSSTERP